MAAATFGKKLLRRSLVGGALFTSSQAWLLHRQPCWRDVAFPTLQARSTKHPEALPSPHARTAVVVGAGVAGICTAYTLAKHGFEVLVLDVRDGAAAKGSSSAAAAGGMELMHKFSSAKDWWTMFRQLIPVGIDFRFFFVSWLDVLPDMFYWRWLARFTADSLFASEAYIRSKTDKFLPVVEWGVEETIRVMREVPGLERAAHFSEAGSVQVKKLSDGGGFDLRHNNTRQMTNEEAQAFEPMLSISSEHEARSFVLNPASRFGECEGFTQSLAMHCQQQLSVRIAGGTSVHGFEKQGQRVVGVHTSRGYVEVGDGLLVLCAGAWSGVVCDMLGVFCPIYPLKGYTLLVNAEQTCSLGRLVQNNYVYAVPARTRVRIASIGELGGWSVAVDKSKEDAVRYEATRLLPAMAEQILQSQAVAGLRPFSADETPFVGRIPGFSNVYLNTGPGHTGWKCCAGFAAVLASVADPGARGPLSPVERDAVDMLDPAGRLGQAFTGPGIFRSISSLTGLQMR